MVGWLAAILALLTRLPFAARRLWDHDSVQFALGVEKYDLAAHHPHPPGYPLYIAILKALAAAGVSSQRGMVALAILAGALGAGLIVPLTARLVGEALGAARRSARGAAARSADAATGAGAGEAVSAVPLAAAVVAAALYVFNPLLWFYGELPLVYAVEGGMTVGLAYAALRMADGTLPFIGGCAAFALAGGIRPSTLVLLMPLFLLGVWRAWRRRLRWSAFLGGAAVALCCGLSWLVPMLAAAGGYAAYQRIGREHFSALLPYTSILYGAGWPALAHNLTLMLKWFLQGLLPAAVAVAAAGPAGFRGTGAGLRLLGRNALFLITWALPAMLFFALFHITKAGYTLAYLPALLTAAALALAPALGPRQATSGEGGRRLAIAVLLAAGTGAALFLFGADRRPDQPRALAVVRNEFNRGAIVTFEHDLDLLLATLRRLPPSSTVLAAVELSGTGAGGPEAFLYPWQRHLQWYLPEYEVIHLVPEDRLAFVATGHQPFRRAGPSLLLPPGTRLIAIVLSGPTDERFPLAAWPLQRIGVTFDLVLVPFSGRLRLPPFDFTTAAAASP
jgi:Protein of unknown function (DUF2723)